MTNDEWDKYVSKLARKIKVQQCVFIEKSCLMGGWKSVANWRSKPKKVITKKEEVKPLKIKESLTYKQESYIFKGKTYKRKFVKSYKRT